MLFTQLVFFIAFSMCSLMYVLNIWPWAVNISPLLIGICVAIEAILQWSQHRGMAVFFWILAFLAWGVALWGILFVPPTAVSIGIIGGADGPTAIFVTRKSNPAGLLTLGAVVLFAIYWIIRKKK